MFRFLLEKLRAVADRHSPQHLRDARRGEQMASDYLRDRGYRIVARNYRPRHGRGEIDLIGWDGERLAFVEVKTRGSEEFGRPEQAVDPDKRRHLIRAAHDYARRTGVDPRLMRFDIASIVLDTPPRIKLYKAAFTARQERGRAAARRRFHGNPRTAPPDPRMLGRND